MSLNKDAMRKGAAAIKESVDRAAQGGGTFKPFLRNIYWKDDEDYHYLLILNPIDDIPKLSMQRMLPSPDNEGWFTDALARTEPIVGEKTDPMEDVWLYAPKDTNVMVAVELEPQYEMVKGRQRPRGFEVATITFNRRILDEDGEVTEETEEVTAPAIGVISQSPNNFGNQLTAYDANDYPIHEGPIKIMRVGSGTETAYSVQGYPDQEVDLTNLIEFVDGISYLQDRKDEVLEACKELEPNEAALLIGEALLDLYIEELGDEERYNRILDGITEPSRYPSKKGKKSKKAAPKERPARPSQRRAAREEPAEEGSDEPKEAPPASDRMQELRKRAAATRKAKESAEEASV